MSDRKKPPEECPVSSVYESVKDLLGTVSLSLPPDPDVQRSEMIERIRRHSKRDVICRVNLNQL
jgi:hypothetical protein